jgi:hypothetical protein
MVRWTAAALALALVGCGGSENDLASCQAEGMRAQIPASEQGVYARLCMGGRGYGYDMGQKECVSALSNGINFAFCFHPRWRMLSSGSL